MILYNRNSAISLFLLVILSALLLQFIFPWWIVTVVGLAASFISTMSARKTFFTVFTAIAVLWAAMSLMITYANADALLPRIAGLFQLPSTWMIFVITVLIGASPASIAALGASFLSKPDSTYRRTS